MAVCAMATVKFAKNVTTCSFARGATNSAEGVRSLPPSTCLLLEWDRDPRLARVLGNKDFYLDGLLGTEGICDGRVPTALPVSPAQFTQIGSAGANSGVREIGKDPIHAETEELQIFHAWIASIVGSEIFPLVSERENMHEQAELVRVGNDAGCFLR
jgi:hypothetical protein